MGIGITTLGIMNTGADDTEDESTDGGGSGGGGGSSHVCPPDDIQLADGSFYPQYMGTYNNELYLMGTDATLPFESRNALWHYDGTTMRLVADTTSTPSMYYPAYLTQFGDKLVFTAKDSHGRNEAFVYDGVNLTEFDLNLTADTAASNPRYYTEFDNKLYFQAENGTDGDELWVWGGNLLNTPTMVGNFNPGDFRPFDITEFSAAGGIVFGAYDGTVAAGNDLYFYDGTGSPVRVGGDMNPTGNNFITTNQAFFHEWNGKIYFGADDGTNGRELWVWDGNTANAPTMIGPSAGGLVAGDLQVFGITDLGGKLYFIGKDSGGVRRLYEYDGISDPSLVPGSPADLMSLIKFNNKVYFEGDDGTTGDEIWSYDGINPPTLVEDINPEAANGSNVNFSTAVPLVVDDRLYFAGTETDINGVGLWYIEAC